MGHVMGIAIVDGQIASVVRDDNDEVIATNTVDLAEESASAVGATIADLVNSAPFEVSRIGVVAAAPALVESLRAAFKPSPMAPAWYAAVTVDALDSAMVRLARTDPALGPDRPVAGSVAVLNLDEYTAPTSGLPIIAVDPRSGAITGRAAWQPGYDEPTAVLDPSGAANVADAITSIPGSDAITHVVFTGTGADVPGVHAAFERALGRPVVVAAQPRFAIAGAAAGLARAGVRPGPEPMAVRPTAFAAVAPRGDANALATPEWDSGLTSVRTVADKRNRRRWWLVGGTVAAGFVILGGAIAAVLLSTGTAQRVVGVTTVSVTTQTATVTHTETRSNHTVETTTVTPPTRTQTVTRTSTRAPSTVTETETETLTVTEQQLPGVRPPGYYGP